MLLGQAFRIAKILKIFIGEKPLRVLDFAEPGIFGEKKTLAAEDTEITERENQLIQPWELAERLSEETGVKVIAARDGMTLEMDQVTTS